MSYIRSKKVEQEATGPEVDGSDYGFKLQKIHFDDRGGLDFDWNGDQLQFVLALINQVDELAEGEALVVWKEIF